MKGIKKAKKNKVTKHTLLCLSTLIPLLIFGVAHWFLYTSDYRFDLMRIYTIIGVFTIIAALLGLSAYLCKLIDKKYWSEGELEDDEIYDR